MKRNVVILALLLVTVPTLCRAQDDVRQKGDKACKLDVNKLCKAVLSQGDMGILACLQQNAAKLSRPCRTFLKEIGQLQ
jgi:competence protein ComGC